MMNSSGEKTLTLLQLSGILKNVIDCERDLHDVWITAEVSDLRQSGGHLYMVLVEKDSVGTIVARLRANVWRGTVAALMNRHSATSLPEILVDGNEVRVRGSATYHANFGLSFNIGDIDFEYCRDTSRLQLEILAALRKEGIDGLNKQQHLETPPRRIAIISAENAAGYGDFMDQLHNNSYGIKFYTHTFPAVMQGARTASTVIEALEAVEMYVDLFDCVVIIRGGGASTDLAGFDDLELARVVAKYPLPVAVGIGHERDNTVLDFIAHTRLKTPTAVAEWLIGMSADALSETMEMANRIARYVQQTVEGEQRQIEHLQQFIPVIVRHAMDSKKARIERITEALPLMVTNRLNSASSSLQRTSATLQNSAGKRVVIENEKIKNLYQTIRRDTSLILRRALDELTRKEELVAMLDPRDTLRRGYSITRVNGKAIKNSDKVVPGDEVVTTLYEGKLISIAK